MSSSFLICERTQLISDQFAGCRLQLVINPPPTRKSNRKHLLTLEFQLIDLVKYQLCPRL